MHLKLQWYQNSLHFKFFPISVEGGGGAIEKQFFPKFKKVQNILGGGVKKIMDFFHNLWDFFLDCSPNPDLLKFVCCRWDLRPLNLNVSLGHFIICRAGSVSFNVSHFMWGHSCCVGSVLWPVRHVRHVRPETHNTSRLRPPQIWRLVRSGPWHTFSFWPSTWVSQSLLSTFPLGT